MRSLLVQMTGRPAEAARAFELELRRQRAPHPPAPALAAHRTEILQDRLLDAAVSVVIPLYNYAQHITDALDSVAGQTLAVLDLIVVDDGSADDGPDIARAWMLAHQNRFGRLVLVRNDANVGLGPSRNIGFAHAESRYVVPLDADNRLLPAFAERCLAQADATGAAFVHTKIQNFGGSDAIVGLEPYTPMRLAAGNSIDAMALVRLSAWAMAGGYDNVRFGWEDYDFWCRLAEQGQFGSHIDEVLAEYRVHPASMLSMITDRPANKRRLIADMRARHPWVLDGVARD
jgi:glycosyltransferase involved in cell wall biosynthesis